MNSINKIKKFRWGIELFLITIFQIISFSQIILAKGEIDFKFAGMFGLFMLLEWGYILLMRIILGQTSFELELIAFLFSGIGLTIISNLSFEDAYKQMTFIVIGVAGFLVVRWLIANADRVTFLRLPVAAAAGGLILINLLFADEVNGAKNWIQIGSQSIQPSEFVKIAFIFVGAATLDRLQTTRSVWKYLIFSMGCIGALFLIRDFGTAVVFFATFLIILFMRSGDIRSIILICAAAVVGVVMIIWFKPYVAERFSTYRHIWETPYDKGMQQTRALIYSASGGLFGLGIGKGKLIDVYAGSTDLMFCTVCEEFGLLIGFSIALTFAAIVIYTVASAKQARTSFYAIAACAASGLFLVQISLHVFGVTDLLPWTGVTLPFVSRGGSSMISCWALLAFIKSVDPRAYPKTLKETQALS